MTCARSSVADLDVSAALLVSVAEHEGYRAEAYLDAVGVPTIGFGRTEGVELGQHTTVEREMVLLLKDLDGRKAAIAECVTVPLYQHELDAALSLAYNIGIKAFCGSTMVKTLERRGLCGRVRRDQALGSRRG